MSRLPKGPLVSVSELYPPMSGRYMLVYDLDDLGVDYALVHLYYRVALSCAVGGSGQLRNELGGIKPWRVAANGDVTVTPAGNYLMRLVCNVVQRVLEDDRPGGQHSQITELVKEITWGLSESSNYEILVGYLSDMVASVHRLLPPHTTWISLTVVQNNLAYVYAGQTPVEEPC